MLRNRQKQHLSDDSIREMLELDLDESDISGVSEDSDIDENWEPGNSLLEGKVEDNKDDQETAGTTTRQTSTTLCHQKH